MQEYNYITPQEYNGSYYTRPVYTFSNNLQPTAMQPLPPAVWVNDIQSPATTQNTTPTTSTSTPSFGGISSLNFDRLNSSMFSNSMLTRGIDKIGYDVLGIGKSTVGPSIAGKAAPNVSGITGGLTKSFSPASTLAGFAGTVAADVLGLSGKYSGITGTLGSIGGTVAGAKLGTIAGMAGGPVGAALGGLVGSALGGLFGSKKPNPASVVGSNQGITSAGTFAEGGTIRSKHAGNTFATEMRNMVDTFNSSIHQQTGLDLSKTIKTLYAGYDVNHGPGFISFNGYYRTDHPHHNKDNFFTFDPNNQQSMVAAFRNYGSKLLQDTGKEYSPEQIQSIVNNAVSSLGKKNQAQGQGTTVVRQPALIQQKTEQGNKFTEFLKQYNTNYSQQKVA